MGQAHEISEKMDQIYRIAHGDFLETLSAVMPYLRQRREAARIIHEKGQIEGYEYLQSINKEIRDIFSLF